ncbi:MAG: sensor histidine kinase, partial [Wenyingzhuangia sp.]
MRIKNFFLFSAVTSLILTLCIDIVVSLLMYSSSKDIDSKTLLIFSGVLFIVITIVLNYSLNSYIRYRINKIYNQVNSLKKRRVSNINVNADEFDFLARDILKYSYKKKKEINKLNFRENYRRDFLGNVAHELKTPLFTVQGYLLTLIEGAAENKVIREKYL